MTGIIKQIGGWAFDSTKQDCNSIGCYDTALDTIKIDDVEFKICECCHEAIDDYEEWLNEQAHDHEGIGRATSSQS